MAYQSSPLLFSAALGSANLVTSSSQTLIHTVSPAEGAIDWVAASAVNNDTADALVSIWVGSYSAGAPNTNRVIAPVPNRVGAARLLPPLPLTTGTVRAQCETGINVSIWADGSAARTVENGSDLPLPFTLSEFSSGVAAQVTDSYFNSTNNLLLHTAPVGTASVDFIELWACNLHATNAATLILAVNNVASTNQVRIVLPPRRGLKRVITPVAITNGGAVRAWLSGGSGPVNVFAGSGCLRIAT